MLVLAIIMTIGAIVKQFLAVFTGTKTGAQADQWNALSETDRNERVTKGKIAWTNWMTNHSSALSFSGGPLGKTKLVDSKGIKDISNQMSAFVVIKAESQEAAAKMFLEHPHFTIFPGDGAEIMEVMPMPAM